MFQAVEAVYERHDVLKANALNELVNSSISIVEQTYASYGDGILKDFVIEQQEGFIVVKNGLLKFQNKVYCNEEDIKLRLRADNELEFLKVVFQEPTEIGGVKKWSTDLVLDNQAPERNNEFEICRFQYQEGATLRNIYTSFKDCASSYNVVNLLYAKYASPDGEGLSPKITAQFAREMQRKELNDPIDFLFMMECARGDMLSRGVLLSYLKHKTGFQKENASNQELFRELDKILEGQAKTQSTRSRDQRMIII